MVSVSRSYLLFGEDAVAPGDRLLDEEAFRVDQLFDLLGVVFGGAGEEDDVVVFRHCLEELAEERPQTDVQLVTP